MKIANTICSNNIVGFNSDVQVFPIQYDRGSRYIKIDCKTSETNEGYEKLVYYAPSTPTTHYLGQLVVTGKG